MYLLIFKYLHHLWFYISFFGFVITSQRLWLWVGMKQHAKCRLYYIHEMGWGKEKKNKFKKTKCIFSSSPSKCKLYWLSYTCKDHKNGYHIVSWPNSNSCLLWSQNDSIKSPYEQNKSSVLKVLWSLVKVTKKGELKLVFPTTGNLHIQRSLISLHFTSICYNSQFILITKKEREGGKEEGREGGRKETSLHHHFQQLLDNKTYIITNLHNFAR